MQLEEIDALFFDFDGVILDSTKIKTEAFEEIYRPYGEEVVQKVLQHHLSHGGISRVEKIAYYHETFLNRPLSKEDLHHLCEHFSNRVKEMVVSANWIPGAEDFLESHSGKTDIYVISGTPEPELNEIVTKRKMNSYFKEIFGSPTKKPIHVNRLLKREGYRHRKSIFIGDALTDYKTAMETGVHFIGIQGEIEFPQGTTVLPDCLQLEKAIRNLRP